jgi:hypothetical protein
VLPDDFVVREVFQVRLDAESLNEFSQKFGSLAGFGEARLRSLPAGLWVPGGVRWDVAQLDPDIPDDPYDDRARVTTYMVPVSALAFHILMLRTMAAHLQVHFEGGGDDDFALAWMAYGATQPPKNESQAWVWFDSLINMALQPYHARFETYPGGTLTGAKPAVTLYNACAIQLYNYVAEGSTFARCANERCPYGSNGEPALFTRQRGRAEYGQHRSGARYCSNTCARAQAERERRRRLRLESADGKR